MIILLLSSHKTFCYVLVIIIVLFHQFVCFINTLEYLLCFHISVKYIIIETIVFTQYPDEQLIKCSCSLFPSANFEYCNTAALCYCCSYGRATYLEDSNEEIIEEDRYYDVP
jgi:hypothetical protein